MNKEEIVNLNMKDIILDKWKSKLSYPFNQKDLEELENIINYYEEENNQLRKQYCERIDCSGRLGNSKKVEELIKENERLEEELEQLRENYKAVLKQRDDTNKSAMETIEKYQQENEKLNHYKLLYQKVKERNDKAIEYLEQALEYSKKDCIPSRQFTCEKALKILKGNED